MMIDDNNCIHLHVMVRARAVYVAVECYSYHRFATVWGECAKGTKTQSLAHPKV
jgi:hypothetical protein